jgi:hypothetical protein
MESYKKQYEAIEEKDEYGMTIIPEGNTSLFAE